VWAPGMPGCMKCNAEKKVETTDSSGPITTTTNTVFKLPEGTQITYP
jgi:hypothetical protein